MEIFLAFSRRSTCIQAVLLSWSSHKGMVHCTWFQSLAFRHGGIYDSVYLKNFVITAVDRVVGSCPFHDVPSTWAQDSIEIRREGLGLYFGQVEVVVAALLDPGEVPWNVDTEWNVSSYIPRLLSSCNRAEPSSTLVGLIDFVACGKNSHCNSKWKLAQRMLGGMTIGYFHRRGRGALLCQGGRGAG